MKMTQPAIESLAESLDNVIQELTGDIKRQSHKSSTSLAQTVDASLTPHDISHLNTQIHAINVPDTHNKLDGIKLLLEDVNSSAARCLEAIRNASVRIETMPDPLEDVKREYVESMETRKSEFLAKLRTEHEVFVRNHARRMANVLGSEMK